MVNTLVVFFFLETIIMTGKLHQNEVMKLYAPVIV